MIADFATVDKDRESEIRDQKESPTTISSTELSGALT